MVTAIKALCISENQDELACIGGLSYIGVGQPAARPGEGAHAHDMVGTCAACLDKVRRWQAVGVQALFLVTVGQLPWGRCGCLWRRCGRPWSRWLPAVLSTSARS